MIPSTIAADWQPLVSNALTQMDSDYLQHLQDNPQWLPGPQAIFNAFTLPLHKTRYILFGESPYPRSTSANGYAFWDAAVDDLWSEKGLSKSVNRATSLRNIMKMLLVAEGLLAPNETTQDKIAALDKKALISSIDELFAALMDKGFLLLNASLVLSDKKVSKESQYWLPFMTSLLQQLHEKSHDIQLILFGKIAEKINAIDVAQHFVQVVSEHPYNISFITNPEILDFFRDFHLLRKV